MQSKERTKESGVSFYRHRSCRSFYTNRPVQTMVEPDGKSDDAMKQGESAAAAAAVTATPVQSSSTDEQQKQDGGPTLLDRMYAGTSNLMSAIEATNASKAKRKRSQQELDEEKVAANRRSAKESRNRKKLIFEELQKSVARLAQENSELRRENETMKVEMAALKAQMASAGLGIATNPAAVLSLPPQQQQTSLQQVRTHIYVVYLPLLQYLYIAEH